MAFCISTRPVHNGISRWKWNRAPAKCNQLARSNGREAKLPVGNKTYPGLIISCDGTKTRLNKKYLSSDQKHQLDVFDAIWKRTTLVLRLKLENIALTRDERWHANKVEAPNLKPRIYQSTQELLKIHLDGKLRKNNLVQLIIATRQPENIDATSKLDRVGASPRANYLPLDQMC